MSAMIWAAYERVSTEEQAQEGHSIQVQSLHGRGILGGFDGGARPASSA